MLTYESSGQGLPVVLIHAFPLFSGMWKSQMKSLSKKNRLIAVDLPGFGRSPCQTDLSVPGMARDIAELLESLNIKEPAVIAGLSMGGYAAFEFYRQFPDRVKALGLFSTKPGADSPEARAKRLESAEVIQKEGLEAFAKTSLASLAGKSTQAGQPAVIREIAHMISSNSREGVSAALRAMADRRDSTSLLAHIQCPVLIIAGEEDTLIPSSESETMHAKIAGSGFHLLLKAGHLVNLESPQAFDKIFRKFLQQEL